MRPESCVLALLCCSVLLTTTAGAQPKPMSIALPSYTRLVDKSPNLDGTTNPTPDWVRIYNAGAVAKIVVASLQGIAGSGDGSSGCMGSPKQMFSCMRDNGHGQMVIGYVY